MTNIATKPLRSFGRRHGRKLQGAKSERIDTLLPQVQLALKDGEGLQPAQLFGAGTPLWIEIGFGGGEHLAALAQANPQVGFIGCEPFMNGVAKLLMQIEICKISNVKVWADDARMVLDALPDASVERVYILYPDPWPKVRHHKRRLVQPHLLAQLARVLKQGGLVQLATDHDGYASHMLQVFLADERFAWTAKACADWQQPPEGWVPTRYEEKCLEGTPPTYLRFVRV